MIPNIRTRLLTPDLALYPFAPYNKFVDQTFWLGAYIRVLPGPLNANADITIAHAHRIIPRFVKVLDAGKSFQPQPKRAATAWDAANIYIQLSTAIAAGDNLTLMIG